MAAATAIAGVKWHTDSVAACNVAVADVVAFAVVEGRTGRVGAALYSETGFAMCRERIRLIERADRVGDVLQFTVHGLLQAGQTGDHSDHQQRTDDHNFSGQDHSVLILPKSLQQIQH